MRLITKMFLVILLLVGTLAIAGEPVTGPIIDNYGPVFAALESGIRKFDTSIAGLSRHL